MKTLYQKLHDARMAVPWHISRVAESAGNHDANWPAEVNQVTNERNIALYEEEICRLTNAMTQGQVAIDYLLAGASTRNKSAAMSRIEEGLHWLKEELGEPIVQDAIERQKAERDLAAAQHALDVLGKQVMAKAQELVQQIKGCGASPDLTTASIMAQQIGQMVESSKIKTHAADDKSVVTP